MTDEFTAGMGAVSRHRAYKALLARDLPRNKSPESLVTMRVWRANQALQNPRGPILKALALIAKVASVVWIRLLMGAELPGQVTAGPGLELPHGGRGVILHPTTQIGQDVTIFHGVTVGVVDDRPGPRIGDGVFIGTGASILGPVFVADGARIGAGAVVTGDLAPNSTNVGVPARRVDKQ